jgi:hypothetical protein
VTTRRQRERAAERERQIAEYVDQVVAEAPPLSECPEGAEAVIRSFARAADAEIARDHRKAS